MRIAVPAFATAVAAGINVVLWPDFGLRYPLIGFYPAILISALVGGLRPGVACTLLSASIAACVWFDPRLPTPVSRAADAVALLVFVTIGIGISVLTDISAQQTERERIARHRAEAAEREVAEELADMRRLQQLTVTVFRREEPGDILRDLLRTAAELLGARAAHVHLCEEPSRVLKLAAHVGLPARAIDRLDTIRQGDGPVAEAFTQQRRLAGHGSASDGDPDTEILATPLVTADGNVLGVLTTYTALAMPPAERRLRFLDASVRQTAQALERCRLLQRERAARRNAEEASRLKDSFLSTVSHELRTPLNAVLGWAEMLRAGHLSEGARQRALDTVCDNAHRQVQLIEDLLDVSRITAGTLRIQPEDIDLVAVVRKAVEVVEPAAKAKDLNVVVEGSSLMCRADPGRLQQVLWNLLTNAVKFTSHGGTIRVTVRHSGEIAEIRVADTGIGIPAAFLPFVFDPFRQADPSTTRAQGGLGLGLSIVKQLVEAHGGTVTVESGGKGQGAMFTIRLRAPAMTRDRTGTDAPRDRGAEGTGTEMLAGIAVLLVDDDPDSREVIAVALSQAGATVRVTASAREALESLAHHHVNVILADIAMPEQDGYAFIREVRASPSPEVARLPAIAVTSLVREEDRRDAGNAGFQLHLAKPITPHRLTQAVATIVPRCHPPQPA